MSLNVLSEDEENISWTSSQKHEGSLLKTDHQTLVSARKAYLFKTGEKAVGFYLTEKDICSYYLAPMLSQTLLIK